jgi:hypothetical protein
MKERPILFSAPMVRAILDGSKTQTRRAAKPQPLWIAEPSIPFKTPDADPKGIIHCPHGQPGDQLWVREAWRTVTEADSLPPRDLTAAHRIWFEADAPHQPGFGKLRPSMFMPRWASRITLEITGVRVERLQDISEADAQAEGVTPTPWPDDSSRHIDWPLGPFRNSFYLLWESINGPGSWEANPWVWVIEFKQIAKGQP